MRACFLSTITKPTPAWSPERATQSASRRASAEGTSAPKSAALNIAAADEKGSGVESGAVAVRFHATAEGRTNASTAASATSPQRYFHAMDYPRSDLAAVSVFIEPAPELLELGLADDVPVAPGACVAAPPPDWVTAGVAGLSAGAAGVAYGAVFCAMATPITPAATIAAAAAGKNFVLVMHISFRD